MNLYRPAMFLPLKTARILYLEDINSKLFPNSRLIRGRIEGYGPGPFSFSLSRLYYGVLWWWPQKN